MLCHAPLPLPSDFQDVYKRQAAKTMNFLTEHKIEQYADLVSRIEEVNAENEKTADALKLSLIHI